MIGRIIGKVSKELVNLDIRNFRNIQIVSLGEESWKVTFEIGDKLYSTKYFEKGNGRKCAENQIFVEKAIKGVSSIYAYNDFLVVYKSGISFLNATLLADERVLAGIADYYKKIYSIKNSDYPNYEKYFSIEKIYRIMSNWNLSTNKSLAYILSNADNIISKLTKLEKGVLMFANIEDAFAVDESFNVYLMIEDNLFTGNRTFEVLDILQQLDDCNQKVFRDYYGLLSDDETIIGYVVGNIIKMYKDGVECKKLGKMSSYLNVINDIKFLNKAVELVEWH